MVALHFVEGKGWVENKVSLGKLDMVVVEVLLGKVV